MSIAEEIFSTYVVESWAVVYTISPPWVQVKSRMHGKFSRKDRNLVEDAAALVYARRPLRQAA